jgi:hypothetical protein
MNAKQEHMLACTGTKEEGSNVPERAAEPESEARIARRERLQPDRRHGPVREAGQLRAVQPPWIRPAACAGPG